MKAVAMLPPLALLAAKGIKVAQMIEEAEVPEDMLPTQVAIYSIDDKVATSNMMKRHPEVVKAIEKVKAKKEDFKYGEIVGTVVWSGLLSAEDFADEATREERHLNESRLISDYYGQMAMLFIRPMELEEPINIRGKEDKRIWELTELQAKKVIEQLDKQLNGGADVEPVKEEAKPETNTKIQDGSPDSDEHGGAVR